MALKQTINFRGIEVEGARVKVGGVMILRGNAHMELMALYLSPASEKPFDSHTFSCPYDLLGENPIKQGYEYLKTLPDFSDATDC